MSYGPSFNAPSGNGGVGDAVRNVATSSDLMVFNRDITASLAGFDVDDPVEAVSLSSAPSSNLHVFNVQPGFRYLDLYAIISSSTNAWTTPFQCAAFGFFPYPGGQLVPRTASPYGSQDIDRAWPSDFNAIFSGLVAQKGLWLPLEDPVALSTTLTFGGTLPMNCNAAPLHSISERQSVYLHGAQKVIVLPVVAAVISGTEPAGMLLGKFAT